MPYDVVSPRIGLTPNVHRLSSLGHDPLLGLVFGTRDIICGSCTFIDKSGRWQVLKGTGDAASPNIIEALLKVVVHGFSDVFTTQGLPPPFLAPLQLVSVKPGITLKEGGSPVAVRDIARYMYSNGYDLRHFMTTAISPAIAELVIHTYHTLRIRRETTAGAARSDIADKMKLAQMLALTHALLGSANIMKTALYGWNPTAINIAQFVALAQRMLSMLKLSAERDRLVQEHLDARWKSALEAAMVVADGDTGARSRPLPS